MTWSNKPTPTLWLSIVKGAGDCPGNISPSRPLGPPPLNSRSRRVRLEEHSVELGIPPEADALICERGLRELVGRACRRERDLRVLPGHVEDSEVVPVGRQPHGIVCPSDRGRGRPARFDDEYALTPAARRLQLGGHYRPLPSRRL